MPQIGEGLGALEGAGAVTPIAQLIPMEVVAGQMGSIAALMQEEERGKASFKACSPYSPSQL